MKEIQRTKKIHDGVQSTMAVYPDAYIIIVIIGTIKGCGGALMSSLDRFLRGVWLPNQHEFLYPTFTTKACLISAIVFTAERLSLLNVDRELIYLLIASVFIYVKIITLFFKQYDPFMPFENLSSGLLFNNWVEAISDAFRRTATPSSPQSATTSLQQLGGSTAIVTKKDNVNSGSGIDGQLQQIKGLEIKKRD